jgi:hypothetical protein
VNGLFLEPNSFMAGALPLEEQRRLLLEQLDLIRLSLAANLRSYQLVSADGKVVPGVAWPAPPPLSRRATVPLGPLQGLHSAVAWTI